MVKSDITYNKPNLPDFINKPVHTREGLLIGNIQTTSKDSFIVKRNVVNTIYYHIPTHQIKQWDGHALWLKITEEEAKRGHLLADTREDNAATTRKRRRRTTTTTATFRIDVSILNKVRAESDNQRIALNTFVNQILIRFVEWDKFEPKVGMVPVPKHVIVELFRKKSKEEIIDLATNIGKNTVRDIALFMKGKIDLDSFLSWLETEMDNYSIEIRHLNEGTSIHTYIIKHDLGENWSLYQKTVLELIFNEVLKKHVDINTSDSILTFKFEQ